MADEEEHMSIEEIVDFYEDTLCAYLKMIDEDIGVFARNEAIKFWDKTYEVYKGKCLPDGVLDVWAYSMANAKVREFYRKCKAGVDYLDRMRRPHDPQNN